MHDYTYGQREPMENEAMARTLQAQAQAIWPQEESRLRPLFDKEGLEVLDVGCGTGEISSRIARAFAPANVTGIDLADLHIRRAKEKYAAMKNISFRQADATRMPFSDSRFDIALCRHMLQAIPDPRAVVAEMIRVVKPGGWLYALAEDYGMLFFHPTQYDSDEFFRDYGGAAAAKSGSDLRQGRKMPALLAAMKCVDIDVQYICVDTIRVERGLLADILLHWRDGFEEWMSVNSGKPLDDVHRRFTDLIDCARGKESYAAWLIPSISARVTPESKLVRMVST